MDDFGVPYVRKPPHGQFGRCHRVFNEKNGCFTSKVCVDEIVEMVNGEICSCPSIGRSSVLDLVNGWHLRVTSSQ